MGKDVEADFFKTWLRSQYATKIRERKRGARPEDFDRIGTEFHRWLRENKEAIGLISSDTFYQLVERDFDFYCRWYLRIVEASRQLTPGMEHVFYNAQHGFTLQYVLLLAPLTPDDDPDTARRKIWLVSRFVDILVAWRLWNFRSIAYSTMQYAMFLVMRNIRGLDTTNLGARLHQELSRESETFASNHWLRMHQQNRYALHRLLARMTDYIETRSGLPSRYAEYVSTGRARYEIEHIWADHYDRHQDEFDHPRDFADYRNRIGGLLLLPKSFNASYGDLPYADKLPHYNSNQNLLARSLHPMCYEHNPGFLQFVKETGLPFRPHPHFTRDDLDTRTELYRQIAEKVWDPSDLLDVTDRS